MGMFLLLMVVVVEEEVVLLLEVVCMEVVWASMVLAEDK